MNIENSLDSKQIEIEKQLQEVTEHINKMRVIADSSMRKCVDGGYQENEAVGAIAIPGADLGISMALLKIGYSPRESFDLVHKFVMENNQSYCWHSDTHEWHGDCVVGCWHCNASIGNSEHYGMECEKVKELLNIVKQKQEEGKGMDMITLDRDHAEQAILVITSSDYTVKPWDQTNSVQYFIYDQVRHQQFLKDLVDFWKKKGQEINYDSLLKASNNQTNSTLGLLGSSKGKPIYSVDVSEENPKIKYLMDAPIID